MADETWKSHLRLAEKSWGVNKDTMLPYVKEAVDSIRDMGVSEEDVIGIAWVIGFACGMEEVIAALPVKVNMVEKE